MAPETGTEPPVPGAVLALGGDAIERTLARMAGEIHAVHRDFASVALVGIPSRGVHVAQRLAGHLERLAGLSVEVGVIDVSMHRDDLHTRRFRPVGLTQLPAELTGKTLILSDDVLFSGRTCRAAMDAISSFGRPARIQLAALIDRGHRELPIQADWVGESIETAYGQRVFVRFAAVDGVPDGVWVERAPAS